MKVLYHDVERFFVTVIGNEPTRGFRQEWRRKEDNARKDHLEPDWDSPGNRALHT